MHPDGVADSPLLCGETKCQQMLNPPAPAQVHRRRPTTASARHKLADPPPPNTDNALSPKMATLLGSPLKLAMLSCTHCSASLVDKRDGTGPVAKRTAGEPGELS